ncbi:MAG: hypothetical protein ABI252_11000 [Candidatus Kapaibacterium sp.]
MLCIASVSNATWNIVGNFKTPFGSGFFFDANNGFIGQGVRPIGGFQPPFSSAIYHTTNGGVTWTAAKTPSCTAVTSINMRDLMTGYASVFGASAPLWKTIDGGASWQSVTGAQFTDGTCVYATSKTITATNWDGGTLGGFSADGGQTWNQVFNGVSGDRSDGVDFSDDITGVATMGPGAANGNQEIYYTANGGLTWKQSFNAIEAWGVYGVKGTQTFFTANEGNANPAQHSIYWSQNGGASWQARYKFGDPSLRLTGHIAGKGLSVYVQSDTMYGSPPRVTNKGMYRSDDLGATWKSVGGPSFSRDSRFVVTGCSGEVVYAFDDAGNIWKTSDGGDGTLFGGSPQLSLKIQPDSLVFQTTICNDVRQSLQFTNTGCENLTIDSITLAGVDLSISRALASSTFLTGNSDSIEIQFHPTVTGSSKGSVTLHVHQGNRTFDTVLNITTSTKANPQRLNFRPDSLLFVTSACKPLTDTLTLLNFGCEAMTIDSCVLLASAQSGGEFGLLSLSGQIIAKDDSLRLPINFTPDSGGTRRIVVHILAHTASQNYDTTLTLLATNNIPPNALSLSQATVSIVTKYCQPLRGTLDLFNPSCNLILIDSVRIVGDQLGEFSLPDTSGVNDLSPQTKRTISIEFRPSTRGTRQATLRLFAHAGAKLIDTTLQLAGTNITSPEPYLGVIPTGFAGDTIRIPIYLRETTDAFSIPRYSFHLTYNTDLLTCVGIGLSQSLSSVSTKSNWYVGQTGLSVAVDLTNPITADSNLQMPLLYALMRISLTRDTLTTVTMDTFSADQKALEPLCNEPTQNFVLSYMCGDRTIVGYIRTGNANAAILSIQPNPVKRSDRWQLTYKLRTPTALLIAEGYDREGKMIFSTPISTGRIGTGIVGLPTISASGAYQIVLRSENGIEDIRSVVIVH